jgi:hypothetical protein
MKQQKRLKKCYRNTNNFKYEGRNSLPFSLLRSDFIEESSSKKMGRFSLHTPGFVKLSCLDIISNNKEFYNEFSKMESQSENS